ncbi:MAG: RidA family protein [Acidobacteriota bacterium]
MGEKSTTIRFINPATLATPTAGYTHVVEVKNGRMIFTAGQVAFDKAGKLVGEGDFRAQTEQVFENLKAALEAVGATFTDVIKLNYFITDASDLLAIREIRDRHVNTNQPPASTLVVVKRLAREEFLVEIEAIAVLSE